MRKIPGYSSYLAAEDGRIVSYRRATPRTLSGSINSDGYLAVCIVADDGIKHKIVVSRLIALAVYGEPPSRLHVARHGDGKKLRNLPGNIQWGTVKDNYLDALRHGTRGHGEPVGGKVTPPPVVAAVAAAMDAGARGCDVARQFGISRAQVSRIKNRKRWAEFASAA